MTILRVLATLDCLEREVRSTTVRLSRKLRERVRRDAVEVDDADRDGRRCSLSSPTRDWRFTFCLDVKPSGLLDFDRVRCLSMLADGRWRDVN